MYDYDFKYGQNFYIFMTEESKEKALNVRHYSRTTCSLIEILIVHVLILYLLSL